MNKKIKAIELLNMKADNKEMPKIIKFQNEEFEYKMHDGEYWYFEKGQDIGCGLFISMKKLNEYVEILEDEEIDKGDMVMFEHEWFVQHMPEMNDVECDLAVKMNAIIYYLLKLDKKINKED